MGNQNAVLSWRNWIFESTTQAVNLLGSFEGEAPMDALQTPQLGDLAISTDVLTNQWTYIFDAGVSDSYRPVHVVGILNTNIVQLEESSSGAVFPTGLGLQLTDHLGNVDIIDVPALVVPSAANDFQSHLFYFVPTSGLNGDRDKCRILTLYVNQTEGCLCGTIDPWTGECTQEPFQAGAIWAGPIWRPPNGVRFRSLVQSVIEERRGPASLGRQRYPSVEAKQRSEQLELLLPESAAVGLDPAVGSVQQLASWCGVSRPLLCIPTDTSADLIYASGLYGYLDEPVAWTHVDQSNADGSLKRYHAATLQVTEGL